MGKKSSNLLKTLFAIIVFCSTFLYIVVVPSSDGSSSVLKTYFDYDGIPYSYKSDELAMADDNDGNSYVAVDTLVGTITAYGPDCIGCVSGLTSSGYRVAELVNGKIKSTTTVFNDSEYGELRILAAAPQKFPYGTIIRISGSNIDGYIMGIVLDTGGAMINAWNNGEVLIDLLFDSEKNPEVYQFGRKRDVTFEIIRYGK